MKKYNIPENASLWSVRSVIYPMAKDSADLEKIAKDLETSEKLLPLQIAQMNESVKSSQSAREQGQYAFGRTKLKDTADDISSVVGKFYNGDDRDPEYQQRLSSIQDPVVRSMVDKNIKSNAFQSALQNATAMPALNPLGFANREVAVKEITAARENMAALSKLANIQKVYEDGLRLGFETDQAETALAQFIQILDESGNTAIARELENTWTSGGVFGGGVSGVMKKAVDMFYKNVDSGLQVLQETSSDRNIMQQIGSTRQQLQFSASNLGIKGNNSASMKTLKGTGQTGQGGGPARGPIPVVNQTMGNYRGNSG
jgi:hypothetical protein